MIGFFIRIFNYANNHIKNVMYKIRVYIFSARYRVDYINPIVIPESVDAERRPPESIVQNFSGRLSRFDYKTIFYDAYVNHGGRGVRLCGPPLRNLSEYVASSVFRIDGNDISDNIRLKDESKKQKSRIVGRKGRELTVINEDFEISVPISLSDSRTFRSKNVLVTLNKDNLFSWIFTWASFYVKAHGVNALLIYDTGSTNYTADELCHMLSLVPGIEAVVVVHWPFVIGPFMERPGVKAEADYMQVAMLDHAREKYLSAARSVIHCDVDELIYSNSGVSICDAVQIAPNGAILVPGIWISSETVSSRRPLIHCDFRHLDPTMDPCLPKWAFSPVRLSDGADLQVHRIGRIGPLVADDRFRLAHFRGISTNWREYRTNYDSPSQYSAVCEDICHFIRPFL
ncbi:hypothetical protein ACQQ2Q_21530 [Agrobacterium sp. ES01]|uniref:hypothetical protein n=1 Tax=Agrobacterium sp. ES01 TaxID=3420714 RepID=UPI003D0BBA8A